MVYAFLDKKFKLNGIANEPNYQLANELHKPINRKFTKRKVYSFLETIFWVLIQPICNHSVNITKESSTCAVDLFSKYAWVVPIKDKKGNSIVDAFKKILSN